MPDTVAPSAAPAAALRARYGADLPWIDHLGREYCDISPPAAPFECAMSRMAAGGQSTRQAHNVAEMFAILSGRAIAHIADDDIPLGPTDSVYVPPGVTHHLSNPSETDPLVYILVCWSPVVSTPNTGGSAAFRLDEESA